jgi:hypothetical protein
MINHVLLFILIAVAAAILAATLRKIINKPSTKPRVKSMQNYQLIEPTVQAARVVSITTLTTAFLDDGSTMDAPAGLVVGDYVINAPNTIEEIMESSVFESKYKAV